VQINSTLDIYIMVSIVQSVRVPKDQFTLRQAKSWVKKHGYKLTFKGKGVDVTENQYRFRQRDPGTPHKRVRTKVLPNGVEMILYYI
jgi:hypothetical protein